MNEVFTVVITEQAHLDSIQEYRSFLKPFLDREHIAFCRWRTDGASLSDAVPELASTVSRHENWRLIVVCNEDGLHLKNPFEVVSYRKPEWPRGMDQQDYLELVRQSKFAAFEQAARQPLTRLMTWLCQSPTVSMERSPAYEDPEFAEYVAEFRRKQELRQAIRAGEEPEFTLPSEILCLAKRCYREAEYDIQTSWALHQDHLYSRFYDWNLYFDKMRYLVFDILPKNHRNYTFDYIRFLYALMLLAEHEVPKGSLNPNRVYALSCENDEEALKRLLGRFDSKLAATQDSLNGKIRELQRKEKPRLSDQDAQMIFCSNVTVPVTTAGDFDTGTLYVSPKGLGLSTDCPRDEDNAWDTGYQKSRRALAKYMKYPRRALKKTATELRRLNTADLDEAGRLNAFQLEDVADHTAEEELKMVATRTCDLYDTERYTKDMEAQSKRIHSVIETRMTRAGTVALGSVILGCYLVGFLPMLLTNTATVKGVTFSLYFLLSGLALMAAVGLVTLFFLRRPLRAGYSDYNGIMKGVVDDVDGSLLQYSLYLSHACNMMRGYSVLNFRQEHENPEEVKLRVLKKHLCDLQRTREELREVFGPFLPETVEEGEPQDGFAYDFSRPVDFAYPIPYSPDGRGQIEFLQVGNTVEVPVDFVRRMSIRREDLYD